MRCCLWCFEKFIQYVNKSAYVLTAMKGKNYCGAASEAFDLIAGNAVRFSVVESMENFFVMVGKVSIAFVTSIIGVLAMKHLEILHADN